MSVENIIEAKKRELKKIGDFNDNSEFLDLYREIKNETLSKILSQLHELIINLFEVMNERLPTTTDTHHFWANPSRILINVIDITFSLYEALKESKFSFEIDKYYYDLMERCKTFLKTSGGSPIPLNMKKVDLYYVNPIFILSSSIIVERGMESGSFPLRMIGEGSYANVYKYKDTFYNKTFVVKRAKGGLNAKELERLKIEFEQMNKLSSPYILEVFRYNESKNEYSMEYMDYTLYQYIQRKNSQINIAKRKRILKQIFSAFGYLHAKGLLHRDISPKNILLKEYEDQLIIKVSDFGLVKVMNSDLTSINTEFKGSYNDPQLNIDGFDKYDIQHEIYALTRIVYYVMTGKDRFEDLENLQLQEFIKKGMNQSKTKRFKSVAEMKASFDAITI